MPSTTAYCSLMGFDFVMEIDFYITHRGCPATYWDAPEDPEWVIDEILLRLDEPGTDYGPLEATGELFNVLANSRQIDDAILKYLEDSNDVDWLEYDEDFYRDER